MHEPNGLNADAIRPPGKLVIVEKLKRRPVSQTPPASTKGAAGQHADHDLPGQGPLATATVNLGSESAVADNSRELGVHVPRVKNDAVAEVKFPLCDAAVQKSTAATGTSLMRSWRSVLRPATTA